MEREMNDWKVTIHWAEGDGTYELSDCKINCLVGSLGKHATQKAQVKISKNAKNVSMRAMSQTTDYCADIYNGTSLEFSGVISKGWSFSAQTVQVDPVELTVNDLTTKLHAYVYSADTLKLLPEASGLVSEASWKDYKVCDPDDTDHSLAHLLLQAGGISDIQCDTSCTQAVQYLALAEGDYLDEILSELLFEYGLDFIFVGKTAHIISTDPSREPSATITEFRRTLSGQGSLTNFDGVKIEYYKYQSKRVKLASHDWDVHAGTGWTGYVPEGSAEKHSADITWNLSSFASAYSGYQMMSLTAVICEKDTDNIEHSKVEMTGVSDTGCHIEAKAWGWWSQNFWGDHPEVSYDFYGDLFFRSTGTLSMYLTGQKPDSYTFRYMADTAQLAAAAARIANMQKYGGISFAFSAFQKYDVGAVVKMNESSLLDFEGNARIIQRTYNVPLGMYEYKAEGVGAVVATKDIAETEREEYEPATGVDFLRLHVSRTQILATETADSAFVIATARGSAFDSYGLTPLWTLNGTALDETAQEITIQRSQLQAGSNFVAVSVTHDGETITRNAVVDVVVEGITMQWTTWPDADIPPVSTGGTFFLNGKFVTINGNLINGYTDCWSSTYPTDIPEGWYVWQRIKTESSDWAYTIATSRKLLELTATATQWHYTNRGAIVPGQLITLTARATGFSPSDYTWIVNGQERSETGNTLTLTDGSTGVVTATACGFVASIELTNIQDTILSSAYLGIQDSLPESIPATVITEDGTAPITTADPGQRIIKGDQVVLRTKNDDGTYSYVPYIYYNGSWQSADSVPLQYSLALTSTISDVLTVANAKDSIQAYNIFTNLLVSKTAITDQLAAAKAFIKNLKVGSGTGASGSGFRFRAMQDMDETGKPLTEPVFDVFYGDKQLFAVDVDSGEISFGSQFVYSPSEGSIHTLNNSIVIASNGDVSLNNATANNITLNGGAFAVGGFKTVTKDGDTVDLEIEAYSNSKKAYAIVDRLTKYPFVWSNLKMYKCSSSAYPTVAYLQAWGTLNSDNGHETDYVRLYTSDREPVVTMTTERQVISGDKFYGGSDIDPGQIVVTIEETELYMTNIPDHYSSQYESGRIYYEKDSYHNYGTLKIRI